MLKKIFAFFLTAILAAPAASARETVLRGVTTAAEVGTEISVLPTNRITSLAEEPGGAVWIGTMDGLVRLDPATEKMRRFAPENSKLPHEEIYAVAVSSEGALWVGTKYALAERLATGDFAVYGERSGFGRYQTFDIAENLLTGKMWFGTSDGLFEKGDRWRFYTADQGSLAQNLEDKISAVAVDAAGAKWLGGTGLAKFEDSAGNLTSLGTLTDFPWEEGLPKVISDLAVDAAGAKWLATNRGLFRLTGAKDWTNFTTASGLPSDQINAVRFDELGTLWLGTDAGLASFDPRTATVQKWSADDGLAGDRVTAVLIARDGAKWIGTDRGLTRFDGVSWKTWQTAGISERDLLAERAAEDRADRENFETEMRTELGGSDLVGHWARGDFLDLVRTGIFKVPADGRFRPNAPITRAELAKVLVTAAGKSVAGSRPNDLPFGDVPPAVWFAAPVAKLFRDGVLSSAKNFRPGDPVTRAEAVKMIATAFDLPAGAGKDFYDVPAGSWAREPLDRAVAAGLVSGKFAETEVVTDQFLIGKRFDLGKPAELAAALDAVGFWPAGTAYPATYDRALANALGLYQLRTGIFAEWTAAVGFLDEKTRAALAGTEIRRTERAQKWIFRPGDPVTRGEIAKMVAAARGLKN